MPAVDGRRYAIACNGAGIAAQGHEIPDKNTNSKLVNTNNSIANSRCDEKYDKVIEKNTAESKNGIKNTPMVIGEPICGKWNKYGTTLNTQIQISI